MNPTQKPLDNSGALADLTPAVILRCAARYLEIRGWTQGVYYSDQAGMFPPACAIGAIGMAAHGVLTDGPENHGPNVRDCNKAVDYLSAYLHDHGHINLDLGDWNNDGDPTLPYSTGDWNDRHDRTIEQVITTLRAAADDYDWTHASEDDLETYADACVWAEKHPTREGYLSWLDAR
ncbi:hypothetical protein ACNAW0_28695 [Micromonospora sp. SL1-18]|uniref:DUF6197 family protein n=1 Tax=Micromonospora sp. SL1-18 TaxID=3399128 RepID=UPI003A4E2015